MERNNYTVEFLVSALNDLTEIVSAYIISGSPAGAVRIKNKVNKAAAQIALFPLSGLSVPDKSLADIGYRMMIVEKYLMFYRVFPNEQKVIVYRILNGKTNYPLLIKRIDPDNI